MEPIKLDEFFRTHVLALCTEWTPWNTMLRSLYAMFKTHGVERERVRGVVYETIMSLIVNDKLVMKFDGVESCLLTIDDEPATGA